MPPPPSRASSSVPASTLSAQAHRELVADTTTSSPNNENWPLALKLVLAIQSSLDALELTNATFLADLLVGYLPHSDDALYWLARCHFARGRPGAVIEILKSARSLSARFLYARACIEVGKLDDAEYVLVEKVDEKGVVHLRFGPDHVGAEWGGNSTTYPLVEPPCKASILALAGQVFQHSHRKQLACHCYERALAINPFLWTVYEQLCRLGGVTTNEMPPRTFAPDQGRIALAYLRDRRPCSLLFRGDDSEHPMARPTHPDGRPSTAPVESTPSTDSTAPRASENQKRPRSDTPGSSPARLGGSGPSKVAATDEARAKRFQSRVPLSRLLQPNPPPSADVPAPPAASGAEAEAPPATVNEASSATTQDPPPTDPTSSPTVTTTLLAGLPALMATLTTLALAHLALHQRKRPKSRRLVHTRLPACLQSTALAHRFLAATYDGGAEGNTEAALVHYARAHALAPWDPTGMDKYSSLLWEKCATKDGSGGGARDRMALNGLAQYFGAVVPLAPETLVALGNLASRQEDGAASKEKAIELFKRAGMVQFGYAYGWALCGLEYLDMDQLDSAMDAFNRALTVDPDLVTAWFGLGRTYERLDQHVMALQCYQHALDLSGSPEHELCIAHSLQNQGKHAEALAVLESGLKHSNGKDLGIKLELVKSYLHMDDFELAKPLLTELRTEAPHDPEVYYLMAYTHNRLGDKHASLRALMDCQAYLPVPVPQALRTLMDQVENEVELALDEVTDMMRAAVSGTAAPGRMGGAHGDTADTSLVGLY